MVVVEIALLLLVLVYFSGCLHILFMINIYNQYKQKTASAYTHNDLFSAIISLDFRFLDKENSESLWYRLFPQRIIYTSIQPLGTHGIIRQCKQGIKSLPRIPKLSCKI